MNPAEAVRVHTGEVGARRKPCDALGPSTFQLTDEGTEATWCGRSRPPLAGGIADDRFPRCWRPATVRLGLRPAPQISPSSLCGTYVPLRWVSNVNLFHCKWLQILPSHWQRYACASLTGEGPSNHESIARLYCHPRPLAAAAAGKPRAQAHEVNYWPACVLQKDPDGIRPPVVDGGRTPSCSRVRLPGPEAGTVRGFQRPFFVRVTGGGTVRTDILYPLFSLPAVPRFPARRRSSTSSIRRASTPARRRRAARRTGTSTSGPLYFSHETGDPVDTYHALSARRGHRKVPIRL